jgi:hypothetical protein
LTVARTTRRLPGFRFEAQTPPLDEVLPRMDVAVFVGFAASGPLHLPVAVEDASQFAALFGTDAPLAWDARRGETLYARLGPAVRAFFRNGGRRCWVVRVAGRTRPNFIQVPGLARVKPDGRLAPALAPARSEGSWSDSLQAAAALLSRPLVVGRFNSPLDFEVESHGPEAPTAGDILRLTFEEGYAPLVTVKSVTPVGAGDTPGRAALRVEGGEVRWFRLPGEPPIVRAGRAQVVTFDGRSKSAEVFIAPDSAWGRGQPAPPGKPVAVNLALPPADAPAPGSFVRAKLGNRRLWLRADEVRVLARPSLGGAGTVQVSGEAVWLLKNRPTGSLTPAPACEKLLFELRVRSGDEDPLSLTDLGFTRTHARFWGALPPDDSLFRRGMADDLNHDAVRRETEAPRFPLAGPAGRLVPETYLPLLMPTFPLNYLGPRRRRRTALVRDGLAEFGSDIFLDGELKETGAADLLSRADFIRDQSARPRPLRGIHAALDLEEATIIVAPDATHTGWEEKQESEPHPQPSEPLPHPEWWRFLDCDERREPPLAEAPLKENFLDCGLRVVAAPTLAAGESDAAGTLALAWSGEPDVSFILEEATTPDWAGAAVIYAGRDTQTIVYGRASGSYFYRVRAEVGGYSSNWSNGVGVRVQPSSGWQTKPDTSFRPDTLLEVHCSLLRVCAARGDLFAVLSLPDHYREEEARNHARQLSPTAGSSRFAAVGRGPVAPLGYGETRALSFGAVYHPWVVSSGEVGRSGLRRCPPDGAAAGLIARRAFARGAWVAPANDPLRGVVALDPPLRRGRLASLQEAQVNVIRQETRGFLVLSADTLSDDVDYRPVGVRRLLGLLRRMALRLGATYVFEPHDDSFRRLVRRGFEGMLGEMFARGAFAGATPAESFRVVTDSTLNTNQSADLGRFIVELKVAPSLPLTFLTIRLVQSGDRGMAAEEG